MIGGDSNGSNMDKLIVYEKVVGECLVVIVRLGGIEIFCFLDLGLEVFIITEEFFNEYFRF